MAAASGSCNRCPGTGQATRASVRQRDVQPRGEAGRVGDFVAHVRWATAAGRTVRNTHPFATRGRITAHNGGFGEMARLQTQPSGYARMVLGDTRLGAVLALITQQADTHSSDAGAGHRRRPVDRLNLPVTSLNTVVAMTGASAGRPHRGTYVTERDPAAAAVLGTAGTRLLEYPDDHLSGIPLSQLAGHVHQQALLAGPEALLVFDQGGIRSPSTGPPSSKPLPAAPASPPTTRSCCAAWNSWAAPSTCATSARPRHDQPQRPGGP
jgi:hypothetical protein